MFDPLFILIVLPVWTTGMYLLHLARRKRQEAEEQRVPATITARRER